MSRLTEWDGFEFIVAAHIEKYTVPQYGDVPNDQVEEWTPAQCMDSVRRYTNRLDSNARGRLETLRDMVKIAHFACLAFFKLKPTAVEIRKIMRGGI